MPTAVARNEPGFEDPTLLIERPRTPRSLPKALAEREIEGLLDAPDIASTLGLRDRAMLELMYASGLRVSELVELPLASLNLRQGVVRVTGKGGKEKPAAGRGDRPAQKQREGTPAREQQAPGTSRRL